MKDLLFLFTEETKKDEIVPEIIIEEEEKEEKVPDIKIHDEIKMKRGFKNLGAKELMKKKVDVVLPNFGYNRFK